MDVTPREKLVLGLMGKLEVKDAGVKGSIAGSISPRTSSNEVPIQLLRCRGTRSQWKMDLFDATDQFGSHEL